jgi:hypothetical protein
VPISVGGLALGDAIVDDRLHLIRPRSTKRRAKVANSRTDCTLAVRPLADQVDDWSREVPKFTVFVCSTYADLAPERAAVLKAIRTLKLQHEAMEFFNASSALPLETCLKGVRNSDIVVVIVAHRYGSLAPGTDVSFSEAEYREACRLKKPVLVYIRDDAARVRPAHFETDSKGRDALQRWKKQLGERHLVAFFKGSNELALKVTAALGEEVAKLRPGSALPSSPMPPTTPMPAGEVLLSRSDVSDRIYALLEALGNELVDSDDDVTGLIAGTNAGGFCVDDVDIAELGPFEFQEARIPFRARLTIRGESDEDHMFAGDTILVDVSGAVGYDGGEWTVQEYDSMAELQDYSD